MSDATIDPLSGGAADLDEHEPENGDMRSSSALFIGWLIVLAIFGLLYAYDAWTSIQNLITVPPLITKNYDFYRENHLDGLLKPVPWVQLVLAVVAPFVAFALALRFGRARALWRRALLFLIGLAAISAVAASVSAYVSAKYGL